MWKTISLVLPVLIPSWRFFKSIEPSPRVQWSLRDPGDASTPEWHEFRPRPAIVSPAQMIRRLFWNPAWNESLFLVSCAERIEQDPTDHSILEIRQRIMRQLCLTSVDIAGRDLQFRLVFVSREARCISEQVLFVSPVFPTADAP